MSPQACTYRCGAQDRWECPSRNGYSHQPRPFIFPGRLFTLCGLVKSRASAFNLLEAFGLKGNTVLLRTVFISGCRNKGGWEGWLFRLSCPSSARVGGGRNQALDRLGLLTTQSPVAAWFWFDHICCGAREEAHTTQPADNKGFHCWVN